MKYVLFYDPNAETVAKAPQFFPAHSAHIREFQARGTVLMIGPLGPGGSEGALAVFTTREAAESFAQGDPFVLNGAVARWRVVEWREVLVSP